MGAAVCAPACRSGCSDANASICMQASRIRRAIEDVLARDPRTGRFCCGDRPTIADICLVAHLISAKMLCDSDPASYPTARRILDACMQIDACASEHPLRQAGAQTAAPI